MLFYLTTPFHLSPAAPRRFCIGVFSAIARFAFVAMRQDSRLSTLLVTIQYELVLRRMLLHCHFAALPQHQATRKLQRPIHMVTPSRQNLTIMAGHSRNQSIFQCWYVPDLSDFSTRGTQGALVASLGTPAPEYFRHPSAIL